MDTAQRDGCRGAARRSLVPVAVADVRACMKPLAR